VAERAAEIAAPQKDGGGDITGKIEGRELL
jgi:hypothetical protein